MAQWIQDAPVVDEEDGSDAFPLPSYLKFCPGGVSYTPAAATT
eukprot:CAMPEP_0198151716 /NCGR_PEP_ID=MMETSP1443-20131203/56798_1 /TAXON_ID=186043 /ORGANISM="Entomoneis sp., Strain CCMP2396" /LENGTH=42 /DNA_ID= /DNA_START= /DNA_END= /DNA_ORIENTATION=